MRLSILSPFVSINDALLGGSTSSAVAEFDSSTAVDNTNSLSFNLDSPSGEQQSSSASAFLTVDTPSLQSNFYDKIQASKDKLFVIADKEQQLHNKSRSKKNNNKQREEWCVVQVDWEQTCREDATTKGIYAVKRYVRHPNDAMKVVTSQCRFWPEIREETASDEAQTATTSNGQQVRRRSSISSNNKGLLHLVDPTKTVPFEKALSKWKWVRETIHLFEEQLVGPFDFVILDDKPNRISPKIWNELKSNVVQRQQPKQDQVIDLDSIDRKVLIHWTH